MESKQCTKCGEVKSLSAFYKSCGNICKVCKDLRTKAYYKANKEKVKIWYKKHYQANIEKNHALQKAYREANKEKIKAYFEANREKIRSQVKALYAINRKENIVKSKAYYEANKESIKAKFPAYYAINREKILAKNRKYIKEFARSYIAITLGLPVKDLSDELMYLKRMHLKLYRACR